MCGFTSSYDYLINKAKEQRLTLASVICECKIALTGSEIYLESSCDFELLTTQVYIGA